MNHLINPAKFGQISSVFANTTTEDDLGAGVTVGYGVIGYKGKVWSTRYQGVETPLMREDGDGPRGSIEVVIIKASSFIAKRYYANGFTDDAKLAPDCQSVDGVKPDASVINKQSATCANCPQNAWGARITESGKAGKACSDSKRIAVIPAEDLANELLGGPMLLNVPAASLKDLKSFGDKLSALGYPYYAVATRIGFDPSQAYPKFTFGAIRALDDAEAREILRLRDDPRVARIISEPSENARPELPAPPAAESMFEQPPTGTARMTNNGGATMEASPPVSAEPIKRSPKAQPKETKAAPPPATPTPEVIEAAAAPADFDDMLDGLLK